MSTFQMLANHFTFIQGYMVVLIIFFTFLEIRKWKNMKESNQSFINWFIVRSVIMVIIFMISSFLPAMLISFFTMVCVSSFGGNFYLPGPNNKRPSEWIKYKTLRITISRNISYQILFWFIIDVFAYLLWMLIVPHLLSFLIKDMIIMQRF